MCTGILIGIPPSNMGVVEGDVEEWVCGKQQTREVVH
jgi:hypothetical protein